ncbi:MAG: hypothetical protein F4Y87_07645, partial [Synechococcus sp. SB0665_bin_28]|nr:hypothetical protein [Synechococcus sp. SB0665_bin_28]MYF20945.1 hypothetical protein [Synechococcus sp. SB0677_bin_5]
MARSTLKKVRGIELLYGWSGLGVLGFLLGASILPAAAQSPSTEPAVSITGGPSVTEGADATFTLTANPAPAADITVKVHLDDRGFFAVPWVPDLDREVPDGYPDSFHYLKWYSPRKVTIGTGGTASFTVATVDDSFAELHGAIDATVQAGDGYSVGSPSSASVTVKDNDSPDIPDKVTLSIRNSSTITEGTVIVLVARPSTRAQVSVPTKVKITRTGDFMATAHGNINWPSFSDEYRNYQDCLQGDGTGKGACTHDLHLGALRAESNIYNIGTWNDGVDEPDGTLTAVVEYEKTGETVTSNSVTLSIRDNDPTVVSLVRTGTVS